MTTFFEYHRPPYRVLQVPILNDNYVYIISNKDHCYVVDPGRTSAVNNVLEQQGLKPTALLNTHHHWDHTDGNLEFVKKWNCPIYGFDLDAQRIPGITNRVSEGDHIQLGPFTAEVLFIPGHTLGHIAYYFKEQNWLFSGDTLFSLGCGRLFEGTPKQMQQSLSKLRNLPKETLVFCTHEYTKDNLTFSKSLFPEDKELQQAQDRITKLLADNKPTVPMTIGDEIKSNLFLRWDDEGLRKKLDMPGSPDWEVFAEVRSQKDQF